MQEFFDDLESELGEQKTSQPDTQPTVKTQDTKTIIPKSAGAI